MRVPVGLQRERGLVHLVPPVQDLGQGAAEEGEEAPALTGIFPRHPSREAAPVSSPCRTLPVRYPYLLPGEICNPSPCPSPPRSRRPSMTSRIGPIPSCTSAVPTRPPSPGPASGASFPPT